MPIAQQASINFKKNDLARYLKRSKTFKTFLQKSVLNTPYEHLFELINLSRLSQCRLCLDLSTMYQIVHNNYAYTNYFYKSFVPRTVCEWNNLPTSIVSSSSPSLFKSRLWVYIS